MGLLDLIADIIKAKQDKKDSQVVVKNYISGNNTQNNNSNNKNNNNTTNNNNQRNPYTNNTTSSNKTSVSNGAVLLEKIRLYCTGAKGKVYTTTFRKSMNHNFGIEVIIKNNTAQIQTVKLGHCIYDESGTNTMFKGTFHPKIKPYSTLTENIFVDAKAFAKMKRGKYKSQFWLNDKKVQKVFFTVEDK